MHRYILVRYLALQLLLNFVQAAPTPTVVAGGERDFMLVRHFQLRGSNQEIGRQIAQIARSLRVKLQPAADPIRNKLQCQYFKLHYPQHFERMQGVADEYGVNIGDFARSVSFLPYAPGQPGCSVVFYPGNRTAGRRSTLSRNMDMPVDIRQNGAHPYSRPLVFEVHPDSGYPSLYLATNDLLAGAVEGINSEGLSVVVLGDETSRRDWHPGEPSFETGLDELQIVRYLLDNCKDVGEAQEKLLLLKQYYRLFPLHYLIADRHGKSFVFEFSRHRNQARIVNGEGIQCVTNHQISNADLADAPAESVERLAILKSLTAVAGVFTLDSIKQIHSKVTPWMPNYRPKWPSSRTLWHSIYDLDAKTIEVKFYLGETKEAGQIVTKYTGYIYFKLGR